MSRTARRAGFYLLEAAAAAVLLAVAVSLAAQFAVAIARTERDAARRSQALLLADQRMERALARPYEDLTSEGVADLSLTSAEADALGGGSLVFEIVEEAEPLTAKRVAVVVELRDARGAAAAPLRLTAWKYREAPHASGAGP